MCSEGLFGVKVELSMLADKNRWPKRVGLAPRLPARDDAVIVYYNRLYEETKQLIVCFMVLSLWRYIVHGLINEELYFWFAGVPSWVLEWRLAGLRKPTKPKY